MVDAAAPLMLTCVQVHPVQASVRSHFEKLTLVAQQPSLSLPSSSPVSGMPSQHPVKTGVAQPQSHDGVSSGSHGEVSHGAAGAAPAAEEHGAVGNAPAAADTDVAQFPKRRRTLPIAGAEPHCSSACSNSGAGQEAPPADESSGTTSPPGAPINIIDTGLDIKGGPAPSVDEGSATGSPDFAPFNIIDCLLGIASWPGCEENVLPKSKKGIHGASKDSGAASTAGPDGEDTASSQGYSDSDDSDVNSDEEDIFGSRASLVGALPQDYGRCFLRRWQCAINELLPHLRDSVTLPLDPRSAHAAHVFYRCTTRYLSSGVALPVSQTGYQRRNGAVHSLCN